MTSDDVTALGSRALRTTFGLLARGAGDGPAGPEACGLQDRVSLPSRPPPTLGTPPSLPPPPANGLDWTFLSPSPESWERTAVPDSARPLGAGTSGLWVTKSKLRSPEDTVPSESALG